MAPITFVATCVTCPEWQGRERTDSLASLRDYDRHLHSRGHIFGQQAAELRESQALDAGDDDQDYANPRAEDFDPAAAQDAGY